MFTVTEFANTSADLTGMEMRDTRGHIPAGAAPVMATPGAFVAGVAVASAVVAAYEAGNADDDDPGC
ncbi:hypothetical protein [Streptomyces sp. TRM49041]|uniref:hypothetical protein n=1 Tax=Streptomyces sp. TRM49041 TaxID=2603216 RepID=UPI0011EE92EC|nr:hypothetical protein [Streptomyces sp. TRM49041]